MNTNIICDDEKLRNILIARYGARPRLRCIWCKKIMKNTPNNLYYGQHKDCVGYLPPVVPIQDWTPPN
jgi:hypothetical protein